MSQAADFSLKINGGLKYNLFRDINRGTDGYLSYWADLAIHNPLTEALVVENRESFHIGTTYSCDLIMKINSEYSIGLGLGYLRANNQREILIQYPLRDGVDSYASVKTRVKALPIRFSVFRDYHFSQVFGAYVVAGLEFYLTNYESWMFPAGPGDSHHQKAKSVGLGLLYGLGLEIKVVPGFMFVLEAHGDYARISKLKGKRESGGSSLPYEEKGILYFSEITREIQPGVPRIYGELMIHEAKPSGDSVRRGTVDFSGVALLAGIKIRL